MADHNGQTHNEQDPRQRVQRRQTGKVISRKCPADRMKHQGVAPDVVHDNRKWIRATKDAQFLGSDPEHRWLEEVITEKRKANSDGTSRKGNSLPQHRSVARLYVFQNENTQKRQKTDSRS